MSYRASQVLDEIRPANSEKEKPIHQIQNPNNPFPSLTVRHFIALAATIIFSAAGLVSIEDIAFVVLSVFYITFLSKFVFPLQTPSLEVEPPIFRGNRLLGYYILFAAFVGLVFPLAYIVAGFYEGDNEGIEAAAPHLFLLSSQIFMEGATFSNRFSLPIRAYVPISYNTRRIFSILDWVRSEFGSGRRSQMGRGLAVANLMLWSYNLFGFLIPVYLPRVFQRYHGRKMKDT